MHKEKSIRRQIGYQPTGHNYQGAQFVGFGVGGFS